MSNKRKQAEAKILEFMSDIDTSGMNTEMWKDILKGMSDKDFDEYMKKILNDEASLVIHAPHYKLNGFTETNTLKAAKKYGIPMYEKLVFAPDGKTPGYKTPIEFLIVDIPVRRQSQNIIKKVNAPPETLSSTATTDTMTYQPAGESKGAKVSYPELLSLIGMSTAGDGSLDKTIEELFVTRGGDKGMLQAYEASMLRYGSVNMDAIQAYKTGVKSTQYLKTLLLCQHLKLD